MGVRLPPLLPARQAALVAARHPEILEEPAHRPPPGRRSRRPRSLGVSDAYPVSVAYPSLLFIDSDGKLVHRSVGFHNRDQFLELGSTAADPSRRISALDARYENGDRDPDFLYKYAMTKYDAMDPMYEEVADAYMKTQTDWMTENNMNFITHLKSKLCVPDKLNVGFKDNSSGNILLSNIVRSKLYQQFLTEIFRKRGNNYLQ